MWAAEPRVARRSEEVDGTDLAIFPDFGLGQDASEGRVSQKEANVAPGSGKTDCERRGRGLKTRLLGAGILRKKPDSPRYVGYGAGTWLACVRFSSIRIFKFAVQR